MTFSRRPTVRLDDALRHLLQRVANAFHRCVHPNYVEEQALLKRTISTTETLARDQKNLVEQMRTLSEQIKGQSSQLRSVHANQRSVESETRRCRREIRTNNRLQAQILKGSKLNSEQGLAEARVSRRMTRAMTRSGLIVVGPWTGEVGFELLYWIPFVRWLIEKYRIESDRLIVVSRGGAGGWYGSYFSHHFDILSLLSPEKFASEVSRFPLKQQSVTAFDRDLVKRALRHFGSRPISVLHPTLMYGLFHSYWKRKVTFNRVDAFTSHSVIPEGPEELVPEGLPEEFIAVRFYFSDCFPDTQPNRTFISEVLGMLARKSAVVLLNTGYRIDDHNDYEVARSDNVLTLKGSMPASKNLAVQSAVIRRARAFVGTYGGYSYLAPLSGVDALAFYSEKTFFAHHLEYAQRVFGELGTAALIPLDIKKRHLISLVLGNLVDLSVNDLRQTISGNARSEQRADPEISR